MKEHGEKDIVDFLISTFLVGCCGPFGFYYVISGKLVV
jgi:hypothetical protein